MLKKIVFFRLDIVATLNSSTPNVVVVVAFVYFLLVGVPGLIKWSLFPLSYMVSDVSAQFF